jgi:hypothetical protein
MPAPSITFAGLPSGARIAIETEIGSILRVEDVSTGLNSLS